MPPSGHRCSGICPRTSGKGSSWGPSTSLHRQGQLGPQAERLPAASRGQGIAAGSLPPRPGRLNQRPQDWGRRHREPTPPCLKGPHHQRVRCWGKPGISTPSAAGSGPGICSTDCRSTQVTAGSQQHSIGTCLLPLDRGWVRHPQRPHQPRGVWNVSGQVSLPQSDLTRGNPSSLPGPRSQPASSWEP